MLLEQLQLEPCFAYRRQYFRNPVIEEDHLWRSDRRAVALVGRLISVVRARILEVVELRDKQSVEPRVAEHVQRGMSVANEEPTAGLEEIRDHLRPAPCIGEPAKRADAGVDEVESGGTERINRAIHIALDKLDYVAEFAREPPRGGDRRG